ncbi:sporulation protein [Streptomyces sp. DSM 44917]|uniref:Sporulation protein n=1 Tax=Streptomyces boetiae TaxID=3075541 RepID=A0ABU2L7U9_9ACTN|nr:sporulation protein [Streptomyces sp. DSM 44917]MDT0307641.1 sporulation protein [Streptomyces sp. DSM 44917]
MTSAPRRTRQPNRDLTRLIEASGASHKALAHRINELARHAGLVTAYTHTSVANWARRGMTPRPPVPELLATALAERLGRAVTAADIGMALHDPAPGLGLDFPRDPADAVRVATTFWSHVDRRDFLGTSFSATAFTTPVTRWLVTSADPDPARRGGRHVGRRDLDELWQAADEARAWDARYGGGSWKAGALTQCLTHRAAPLLQGTFTSTIGAELFSATAELSRLAGWSAFDTGQHDTAQRHFVQALRLARAGGNTELGSYVLTTMALQTLLRGFPHQAIDMTQGAYQRARHLAAPRVLAFTKLIEARAHARAHDAHNAATALAAAETLLDRARDQDDPPWIRYVTHARLAADATEIHRDLRNPQAAHAWNRQAAATPSTTHTRSVGLRMTVVATLHLQTRDLDQALDLGHQAVNTLSGVSSARALDYIRDFTTALAPWRNEQRVTDFLHHARTELDIATL